MPHYCVDGVFFLFEVLEFSVFACHGDLRFRSFLHVSDDAGVDVETLGDVDYAVGGLLVGVELHAVTHVEHFVHLLPVGAALVVDHFEQRWHGE